MAMCSLAQYQMSQARGGGGGSIPGGGGALSIYTGGGVPQHIQKGGS